MQIRGRPSFTPFFFLRLHAFPDGKNVGRQCKGLKEVSTGRFWAARGARHEKKLDNRN